MRKFVLASLVSAGLVFAGSLAQADPGCSSCSGGSCYATPSCPTCSAPSVSYQTHVVTDYRPEVRHQTYQDTVYHHVSREVVEHQTVSESVPYTDYERHSRTVYKPVVIQVPEQQEYAVPVTRYREESRVVPYVRHVEEVVPQTVTRSHSYVEMVPYQHTVQVPVYSSGCADGRCGSCADGHCGGYTSGGYGGYVDP